MTAVLRYRCTGDVSAAGFGAFLDANLGAPRANLQAFARELRDAFGNAQNLPLPSGGGRGEGSGNPRLTLVNSGSSANLAAALALAERAGPRKHAVASAFTFPTTLSALLTAGFDVTLAGTEPGGFNLSPDALRLALRPNTGVVCVTHFLGFPARIDELREIAGDRLLLQDACETMDARVAGTPVHERGTVTTWSLYHPHHLSSYGGGAAISLDEEMQRTLESITHWGRACTCHVENLACTVPPGPAHQFTYVRPGHNLEMSELNAAFGRFQLAQWPPMEEARKHRYAILYEALAGRPLITWAPPEGSGSPFVFPFATRERDAAPLAARLAERGVETRSLMGGATADQPAFRGRVSEDGSITARDLARRTLFVGVHQTLPEEDVRAVAAILAEEASR